MAGPHDDESSTTSAREIDDLLDLLQALRAEVELRSALEGARPGVVNVGGGGAEWDVWVGACDFLLDLVHLAELAMFLTA